jgi:hypothetical protein
MGTSGRKPSRKSEKPLKPHRPGMTPLLPAPVRPCTRPVPSGMDPEKRRQLMQELATGHQAHTSREIGDDGRIYYRGQVVGHAPRPISEAQDSAIAPPALSPLTSTPTLYPQAQLSSPPLSYAPQATTYQTSWSYGSSGSNFPQQTQGHPNSTAPDTPQYPPGYSHYGGLTQCLRSYQPDPAYTDHSRGGSFGDISAAGSHGSQFDTQYQQQNVNNSIYPFTHPDCHSPQPSSNSHPPPNWPHNQ